MQRHRTFSTATSVIVLAIFIGLFFAAGPTVVFGQDADNEPTAPAARVYLPFLSTGGLNAGAPPAADEGEEERRHGAPLRLIVDTDPGVDDAVALTWLLSQNRVPVQLLGVVTVAGNTNILAATNNVLNVLARLPAPNVPVVMGAAAPISQTLSKTGWFIHGPDGLWGLGFANPQNPAGVLLDATGFYCNDVADELFAGATVLALGPLTNIAHAVIACPDRMRTLGSVVVLGGAKFGGNKTPVAEFNFWQDPEAVAIVLAAGLPIRQVPLDAFAQATLQLKDVDKLNNSRNPAARFLAPALQQYVAVQIENTGIATIPDAVAAIYALDPTIGAVQPALVKLVLAEGPTRGQSVVGLSIAERVAMIATDAELSALAERAFYLLATVPNFDFRLYLQSELGAILVRESDNVQWLATAPNNLLTKTLLPALRK